MSNEFRDQSETANGISSPQITSHDDDSLLTGLLVFFLYIHFLRALLTGAHTIQLDWLLNRYQHVAFVSMYSMA